MSQRKGILVQNNSKRGHVKIIAEERSRPAAVSPAPPPATITAPKVDSGPKDEIELLREGVKNIHGDQVKKS